MNLDRVIFVAGHNGMVGSAILRKLKQSGYVNVITADRKTLDLCNKSSVEQFFQTARPEYVFLAAARVGGIMANFKYPAEFIHDNLTIQTNVIDASHRHAVKKFMFLGSSCIYPRDCPQPILEEYLMTGKVETTNSAYAIAKIAGIEMCAAYKKQYGFNYVCAQPCNLYGPGDNFDLEQAHAAPAIIRRLHEAKTQPVSLWGTGLAKREFLFVDDLAEALILLMNEFEGDLINVGTGSDIEMREFATTVANVVGHSGRIQWDALKPEGTKRKILDVQKITRLGWKPSVELTDGLHRTYNWYLSSII